MRFSRRLLFVGSLVALFGLLLGSLALSADPGNGLSENVRLDAAPGWTSRSDASGNVHIFDGDRTDSTVDEFDLRVQQLRCRGTAFSPASQVLEAGRYYELVINGQSLMRFNTGCDYSSNSDGIGGDFYTKLIVSQDALAFDVKDSLTIEVFLQPDNILALTGSTG